MFVVITQTSSPLHDTSGKSAERPGTLIVLSIFKFVSQGLASGANSEMITIFGFGSVSASHAEKDQHIEAADSNVQNAVLRSPVMSAPCLKFRSEPVARAGSIFS
jgi:hypothetical protein